MSSSSELSSSVGDVVAMLVLVYVELASCCCCVDVTLQLGLRDGFRSDLLNSLSSSSSVVVAEHFEPVEELSNCLVAELACVKVCREEKSMLFLLLVLSFSTIFFKLWLKSNLSVPQPLLTSLVRTLSWVAVLEEVSCKESRLFCEAVPPSPSSSSSNSASISNRWWRGNVDNASASALQSNVRKFELSIGSRVASSTEPSPPMLVRVGVAWTTGRLSNWRSLSWRACSFSWCEVPSPSLSLSMS